MKYDALHDDFGNSRRVVVATSNNTTFVFCDIPGRFLSSSVIRWTALFEVETRDLEESYLE